ncbi:MAG: hypothetical protein ACXVKA_11990 [Acidimicrobiia bacterium]
MASPAPTTGSLQLRPGQLAAILGVFAATFAIWILPLILGPLAMVFGAVAYFRGERRGLWVIGLALVCIPLGLLVHALPDDIIGS